MFFHRLLQSETAVVCAEGKVDGRGGFRALGRGQNFVLFHKFQERGDAAFNLVPARFVNFIRAADRVADVPFKIFD